MVTPIYLEVRVGENEGKGLVRLWMGVWVRVRMKQRMKVGV